MQRRLVALGRVGRPHGVRGEVRVDARGPLADGLRGYRHFYLGPESGGDQAARPVSIESYRLQGELLLVKFEGCDSPEGARAFTHAVLYVERAEMPPVAEGEYYHADLLGCRVLDEKGDDVGTVADVWGTGPHDVLVVAERGREWMVPVVDQYVAELDLEQRVVRVRGVGELRG